MEIWHRITYNRLDVVDDLLTDWGIEFVKSPLPGDGYILTFEIAESDERWPKVAQLVHSKPTLDVYNTVFTLQEIVAAQWVRLIPVFERGYPQPERGWENATYSGECPSCGAGYTQKAPFVLAKEPRLGKHDFMCLYWTYTFFCTALVRGALEAEQVRGYEVWDAPLRKDRRPSEIVSQLRFPLVAEPGLVPSVESSATLCPECGITKYAPHRRGRMQVQAASLQRDTDIQMSYEWFGSGHMAFREVFVSRRVAQLALQHGWRGIQLKPLALVE